MNLENLLTELKSINEEEPAAEATAKIIPVSKTIQGTSLISKIKNTLAKSNLKNIELDPNQNSKVYPLKDNGEPNKTRVLSNAKLKLHCSDPSHETQNASVDELNQMIAKYNNKAKTGTLNPCKQHNRGDKEQGKSEQSKLGNLDSIQERIVWDTVRELRDQIFKGCKVVPEELTGNKFTFEDEIGKDGRNQNWDADVYLEFTPELREKLGFNGVAFLVDGSTHQGTAITRPVFKGDAARGKSKLHLVTRISISSPITDEKKENIRNKVKTILNNIISHSYDYVGKRFKTEKELSRSQGDLNIQQSKKAADSKLSQEMFERLVANLRNRKNLGDNADTDTTGDNYIDKNNKLNKLSNFLTAKNESNKQPTLSKQLTKYKSNERSKGRESFRKFPDLWGQLIGASTNEIEAWKARHQAKNGEKLFEPGSDGNVKLFEYKKDSAN